MEALEHTDCVRRHQETGNDPSPHGWLPAPAAELRPPALAREGRTRPPVLAHCAGARGPGRRIPAGLDTNGESMRGSMWTGRIRGVRP